MPSKKAMWICYGSFLAAYFLAIGIAYIFINISIQKSTGGVVALPIAELIISVVFVAVASTPMLLKLPALTVCLFIGGAIWRIYMMLYFSATFYSSVEILNTPFYIILGVSLLVGILLEVVGQQLMKKRSYR